MGPRHRMIGDLLLIQLAMPDQTPLVMATVVDTVILPKMKQDRAQILVVGGHQIDCHLHRPHLVLLIDIRLYIIIILIHAFLQARCFLLFDGFLLNSYNAVVA